jgi:quercetin dioxygenase-like cupin family protein
MPKYKLTEHPAHIGLGAAISVEPAMTGSLDWYESYTERNGKDGAEGRLVSSHSFSESWTTWEMHPNGEELVLCTHGAMTLIQEFPDGSVQQTELTAGEYAVNPRGVWHTADIQEQATAVFITSGIGTEQRGR